MKRKLIVLLLLLLCLDVSGQNLYFIQFRNKLGGNYCINNPESFLSQRALDRRLAQGIVIDSIDLPVSSAYIQQVQDIGCDLKYPLKWLNGIVVEADSLQLQAVQQLQSVVDVKPIYLSGSINTISKYVAEDKSNLSYNYGNSARQIQMLNGHLLHDMGYRGDGYIIAVLDAGFANVDVHPAFDSIRINNQILGTRDFVNPLSDIYREHYHGAAVLSTIASNIENKLVGTAPHAKFWLIRTENARVEQVNEEYNWIAGAELADSVGADIINSSLGYYNFDRAEQNHSYSDMDGCTTPITIGANIATQRGILVVSSAGNEGQSAWHYISSPADSPNVLTVGAVDSTCMVVGFSSRGPTYDGRIKPDVCAMGYLSVVATNTSDFGRASGTSFSAPITAGLVACLWQANPTLKPAELISLIRKNSSFYSNPNNDIGYGIPNFANALSVKSLAIQEIEVYPNPVGDVAKVNLPIQHEVEVQFFVYSILGKLEYSNMLIATNGQVEVNMPNYLQRGIYIINILANNQIYTSKLIKL